MKIDDHLRNMAHDAYGYLWAENSTIQVDKRATLHIWKEDRKKAHQIYACVGPSNGIHAPFMTKEELDKIPQVNWNAWNK